MSPAPRRPRHAPLTALIATSFLSAILVFAIAAVSAPGDALGANSTKVAKCSANLRTSAVHVGTSEEGHFDRDEGRRKRQGHRRLVANDVCRQGGRGQDVVPDPVGERQVGEVALRRDLPVRGFRTVQGLRSPGVHALHRMSGERADGSRFLDDGQRQSSRRTPRSLSRRRSVGRRIRPRARARPSQAAPGTGSPA